MFIRLMTYSIASCELSVKTAHCVAGLVDKIITSPPHHVIVYSFNVHKSANILILVNKQIYFCC